MGATHIDVPRPCARDNRSARASFSTGNLLDGCAQVVRRQVRIPLGHPDFTVSEQFLNRVQVNGACREIDDLELRFLQSPPSSSLTRSASFPPVINLAIRASMLIEVTCPNTTARENQFVVVGDLQF